MVSQSGMGAEGIAYAGGTVAFTVLGVFVLHRSWCDSLSTRAGEILQDVFGVFEQKTYRRHKSQKAIKASQ